MERFFGTPVSQSCAQCAMSAPEAGNFSTSFVRLQAEKDQAAIINLKAEMGYEVEETGGRVSVWGNSAPRLID